MMFSKSDFWKAFLAGEGIALLSLPIIKNLSAIDFLAGKEINLTLILIAWLLFLPFITVLGLYLVYHLSFFKKLTVFQIGKYGIIGVLNTVLHAGIFNSLILVTDIAKGFLVIVYFIIAFIITVTNSFIWNKFWTFTAGDTSRGKKEYVKFFTVTAIVSLVYAFLMHVLINIIGAPTGINDKVWANISLVLLIPLAFLGNFFGYRLIVFKKTK